jgi:hypothetical protein
MERLLFDGNLVKDLPLVVILEACIMPRWALLLSLLRSTAHRPYIYVTPNYLDRDDSWLREVVSIGTPLRKVVEEFKSRTKVGELQWFKLKTLEERQKGCEELEKTSCDY